MAGIVDFHIENKCVVQSLYKMDVFPSESLFASATRT